MPFVGVNGGAPGTGETKVVTIVGRASTRSASRTRPTASSRSARTSPRSRATRRLQRHRVQLLGRRQQDDAAGRGRPLRPAAWSSPAGNHTVKEVNIPYGFQFVSSTATGPTGDNRRRRRERGNPITVSVPWFNDPTNGGETLVTFTNKVQRVQLKICKLIEPGSDTALGGLSLHVRRRPVNGVSAGSATVSRRTRARTAAPACSTNIPVVDPNGSRSARGRHRDGSTARITAIDGRHHGRRCRRRPSATTHRAARVGTLTGHGVPWSRPGHRTRFGAIADDAVSLSGAGRIENGTRSGPRASGALVCLPGIAGGTAVGRAPLQLGHRGQSETAFVLGERGSGMSGKLDSRAAGCGVCGCRGDLDAAVRPVGRGGVCEERGERDDRDLQGRLTTVLRVRRSRSPRARARRRRL